MAPPFDGAINDSRADVTTTEASADSSRPDSPSAATVLEQAAGDTEDRGSSDERAPSASERERRGGKKRRAREAAAAKSDLPDAASVSVDGAADTAKAETAAPLPSSDGAALAPAGDVPSKESAGDCALPEKDMAREAWRRNWPTVCALPSVGKAFVLIPIKGPVEGETHALHRRPNREARINLPDGSESQLTLKQYKINRLGFKDVRVSSADGGGKARVRVKLLSTAGDPVFEIKDGYAKITVAVSTKD